MQAFDTAAGWTKDDIQDPGELVRLLEPNDYEASRVYKVVARHRDHLDVALDCERRRILPRGQRQSEAPPARTSVARSEVERVHRVLVSVRQLVPGDVLAATRRRVTAISHAGDMKRRYVQLQGEDGWRQWGASTTMLVERRIAR